MDPQPAPESNLVGKRASVEASPIEPTVTLIETIGALGLLIARKREEELMLEEVVYFQLVEELPRATCFKRVKIESREGFWVARPANQDNTLFFEPSAVPYETRSISKIEFGLWVDSVVYYNLEWIVESALRLYESQLAPGPGGALSVRPVDPSYAAGLPDFLGKATFVSAPSKSGANKMQKENPR